MARHRTTPRRRASLWEPRGGANDPSRPSSNSSATSTGGPQYISTFPSVAEETGSGSSRMRQPAIGGARASAGCSRPGWSFWMATGWRRIVSVAATPRWPLAGRVCVLYFSDRTSKECWPAFFLEMNDGSFRSRTQKGSSAYSGRNTANRPPLSNWADASGWTTCGGPLPAMMLFAHSWLCSDCRDDRRGGIAHLGIRGNAAFCEWWPLGLVLT